jgi:hypothetical protein
VRCELYVEADPDRVRPLATDIELPTRFDREPRAVAARVGDGSGGAGMPG